MALTCLQRSSILGQMLFPIDTHDSLIPKIVDQAILQIPGYWAPLPGASVHTLIGRILLLEANRLLSLAKSGLYRATNGRG